MDKAPSNVAASGLDPVRDKTDASLETERSKTDESIVSQSSIAERDDDRVLRAQQERRATDRALSQGRLRLRLTAEALLESERSATDADLQGERNRTDIELDLARSRDPQTASQVARDAAASLSTRDDLLAIVSHDLRNPLSAISLTSEILSSLVGTDKFRVEETQHLLSIIRRNAALMERLITDLLDVERAAGGSVEICPARNGVDEILSECESLFGAAAARKNIAVGIAGTPGLFARCDRDRILQVLSNLVGNAIKYTPHGGTVSLAAWDRKGNVEIEVADTGSGIPPESQERIFQKFSQLGVQTRQGLGLGLYISRWIVEAHGGKIGVRSVVGQGSTFHFTLPAFAP